MLLLEVAPEALSWISSFLILVCFRSETTIF